MASFRNLKNGRVNVQVRKAGLPAKSATFSSQREAEAWAQRWERSAQKVVKASNVEHTLGTVGRLYCDRQLHGKRSRHLMDLRFHRMAKYFPQPFLEITRVDVNAYKNMRLKEVAGSTVREEVQSINKLFRWVERDDLWRGPDPFAGRQHCPASCVQAP